VAREAFVNAFNRGYFPAIDQLANNAYTDNGKEYKQAFLALYARYVIATARPIVDAMVADGSARDHAAGVRFLLEQAIAYGDADSELTLAKLIASGILRNEDPLEAATRVRIALRLGSPDVRKGAELVWEAGAPSDLRRSAGRKRNLTPTTSLWVRCRLFRPACRIRFSC